MQVYSLNYSRRFKLVLVSKEKADFKYLFRLIIMGSLIGHIYRNICLNIKI